jgi:hypothetical protein
MTQESVQSRTGATYVAPETAFCTPDTFVRAYPIDNDWKADTKQTHHEVLDESADPFDQKTPVLGNKSSEIGTLGFYLRPDGAQLDALATPVTDSHYLGVILKTLLGGESVAAGSTIGASSTTTLIKGASGAGAAFPLGQIGAAEVAGQLEVFQSSLVATNDITPKPSLSATPNTSSGKLVNSWTYYLTRTLARSLAVRKALGGSSNFQRELRGLTGDIEITVDDGEFARLGCKLKGGPWSGPSAAGYSTAAAANPMAGPIPSRNMITLVQPVGTLTRTQCELASVKLDVKTGNKHIPMLGAPNEGLQGVFRDGQRPAATATLQTARADQDVYASWHANQTDLQVWIICPFGTGLTKRFIVILLPTCTMTAYPGEPTGAAGNILTEIQLAAKPNTLNAGTTDLARSPIYIALL